MRLRTWLALALPLAVACEDVVDQDGYDDGDNGAPQDGYDGGNDGGGGGGAAGGGGDDGEGAMPDDGGDPVGGGGDGGVIGGGGEDGGQGGQDGQGGQGGQGLSARDVIEGWPSTPRRAARKMMQKYGQPDEVTETHLVWYANGQWAKTVVHKQEIAHDFPYPHTDVLEQAVFYDVPPELYDDLAQYDGSLIVERTKGTLASRCDRESANFLAINLADQIVQGRMDWQEARDRHGEEILAFFEGDPTPWTDGFRFELPTGATGDPDVATIEPPQGGQDGGGQGGQDGGGQGGQDGGGQGGQDGGGQGGQGGGGQGGGGQGGGGQGGGAGGGGAGGGPGAGGMP